MVKKFFENVNWKDATKGGLIVLGTQVVGYGLYYIGKKTVAYIKAAHAAGKQELAQIQAETKPEEVK
jgi:hypothetical protein